MHRSCVAVIALCWLQGCTAEEVSRVRLGLAPDSHLLRELDDVIAVTSPEGALDRLPLTSAPRSTEVVVPSAKPTPTIEPPREPRIEPPPKIAAPPRVALRRPPLAPTADRPSRLPRRVPKRHTARDVALGIGGAGLALGALSLGANSEAANEGVYVVSGLGLGIGVIGLGTAGVLMLLEEKDEPNTVRAGARGLAFEF